MPFDYRNFQQKSRRNKSGKGHKKQSNYHAKGKQCIHQKNTYPLVKCNKNYNFNQSINQHKNGLSNKEAPLSYSDQSQYQLAFEFELYQQLAQTYYNWYYKSIASRNKTNDTKVTSSESQSANRSCNYNIVQDADNVGNDDNDNDNDNETQVDTDGKQLTTKKKRSPNRLIVDDVTGVVQGVLVLYRYILTPRKSSQVYE